MFEVFNNVIWITSFVCDRIYLMKKVFSVLFIVGIGVLMTGCWSSGEDATLEYHSSAPEIDDLDDSMELPEVLPSTGRFLD